MSKRSILVSLLTVLAVMATSPSLAVAWAPGGQATVHPGVQLFTEGALRTILQERLGQLGKQVLQVE